MWSNPMFEDAMYNMYILKIIYSCTYICIYIYIYTNAYTYPSTYRSMYVYIYIYIHIYIYMYAWYAGLYVYICVSLKCSLSNLSLVKSYSCITKTYHKNLLYHRICHPGDAAITLAPRWHRWVMPPGGFFSRSASHWDNAWGRARS